MRDDQRVGRLRIGDVSVVAVVERHTRMPPGGFLPTSTPEELARHGGWLRPWAVGEDGALRMAIQALCVEADGRRIVVDTCVGPRQLPGDYAGLADDGSFLDALTDAGFGRDDVDIVVCTHLHFDHVGWLTMPGGDWRRGPVPDNGSWVPTFRNARYVINRREYDHWQATAEDVQAVSNVFNLDDAVSPLIAAGQVDFVAADHQVTPSLRLVPTPGHSPGHVSVRITSGGAGALITGDCAHHPVQLVETDWHTVADGDPAQASATRARLLREYTDSGTLIIGTHFPPPGAGHLVTENGAVVFRPVSAAPE